MLFAPSVVLICPLCPHCLSGLDPHLALTYVSQPWISQWVSDPVDVHKFPGTSLDPAYLSPNFSSTLVHHGFNSNIYSVLPTFQPLCWGLESQIWVDIALLWKYIWSILVYNLWLTLEKNKEPWNHGFTETKWRNWEMKEKWVNWSFL